MSIQECVSRQLCLVFSYHCGLAPGNFDDVLLLRLMLVGKCLRVRTWLLANIVGLLT